MAATGWQSLTDLGGVGAGAWRLRYLDDFAGSRRLTPGLGPPGAATPACCRARAGQPQRRAVGLLPPARRRPGATGPARCSTPATATPPVASRLDTRAVCVARPAWRYRRAAPRRPGCWRACPSPWTAATEFRAICPERRTPGSGGGTSAASPTPVRVDEIRVQASDQLLGQGGAVLHYAGIGTTDNPLDPQHPGGERAGLPVAAGPERGPDENAAVQAGRLPPGGGRCGGEPGWAGRGQAPWLMSTARPCRCW